MRQPAGYDAGSRVRLSHSKEHIAGSFLFGGGQPVSAKDSKVLGGLAEIDLETDGDHLVYDEHFIGRIVHLRFNTDKRQISVQCERINIAGWKFDFDGLRGSERILDT